MTGITENSLLINFEVDAPRNSYAVLKALGTRQGYVTYDDIIRIFPEIEQDFDALDQIFVVLRNAGIQFIEGGNSKNDEQQVDEDKIDSGKHKFKEDNLLSNVDSDNLVGLYFCESARLPLLTLEEEVDLAKRIERGTLAREEISDPTNTSAKRHKELLLLIDDSWTAVDHLITSNSRLVISIAKKYTHRGVPFLDLIQEGNIGLMRAVKRFDYKRGFKFSTYATWWIRQAVSRALSDQSRTIRLPVHMGDQLSKMFRTQYKLKQQLRRDPTVVEVADAMGVSSERIKQITKNAQYTLSLDTPISDEGDSVLGDYIEDKESIDPDEAIALTLLRQNIDKILEMLPPREAQILKLRFGLSTGETHTLREVGLKIGVSRERIRQIEAQAIRRLRHPEIQHKLRHNLSQPQT